MCNVGFGTHMLMKISSDSIGLDARDVTSLFNRLVFSSTIVLQRLSFALNRSNQMRWLLPAFTENRSGVARLLGVQGVHGQGVHGQLVLYRMPLIIQVANPGPEEVNPETIRYSQPWISRYFTCGRSVIETMQELQSGRISVHDISPIKVFQRFGLLWSHDNRRLWAFRTVPCERVPIVRMRAKKANPLADSPRHRTREWTSFSIEKWSDLVFGRKKDSVRFSGLRIVV
jgi:hypothetical protein